MPNSASSPRDTSFAGATDISGTPLELCWNSPAEFAAAEAADRLLRGEDTRGSCFDFVFCADSPVEPDRDEYDAPPTGRVSSLVLAVDDVLGADDRRVLIRCSIRSRALPVSAIAFLICGATIFAAILGLLLVLVLLALPNFSAIDSLITTVGIDEDGAAGVLDTASYHGVMCRSGGAAGAGFKSAVDCVESELSGLASPAL